MTRGGVFPFRIAGMQEDQHVRPPQAVRVQWRIDIPHDLKIPTCEFIRRVLIRRVGGIFWLHLSRAFAGNGPTFAVELVEEDARQLALREGTHWLCNGIYALDSRVASPQHFALWK